MADHTGNVFVVRWMFFVLMAAFTALFTGAFMHFAVHFFNETPATMTAFTGFHLVIIIEFSPVLGIGMAADAVTRIMWFNHRVHFISQTNKVDRSHRDSLLIFGIIVIVAGDTVVNPAMVKFCRFP